MFCDKCNADGMKALANAVHNYNAKGAKCGGRFTLDAPRAEAKPNGATTPVTGRSGTVIAGTKAVPEEVMTRALHSPRAGSSGGAQASNEKSAKGGGSPDASAKAQPSVTPKVEQLSSEETQFNADLLKFHRAKAGAALEGADPLILEKLKRLEDGIAPARDNKNWERANKILDVAVPWLREAIASAAEAAKNSDGGASTATVTAEESGKADKELDQNAFEKVKERAEDIMRRVEDVATWPAALKVARDKLISIRELYNVAVKDGNYKKATTCANGWLVHGANLLDAKQLADEQGMHEVTEAFKAIGQALQQAAAIRKRPDCPADEGTTTRWDEALDLFAKAKGAQRWEDAKTQVSALGIEAASLQKASEEEAQFSAALALYQAAKSSAVLQGASADPMARMARADTDIDGMRAAKRWTKAVELVGTAKSALDEAVASAAAAKKAYDDTRHATQDVMRKVDAVADWPSALQAQRDKLAQLRLDYDAAALKYEYDKATQWAKIWQQDGAKLLADKQKIDEEKRAYEQAFEGVQALYSQGTAVREMTPCPADAPATKTWDLALKTHDEAKAGQLWVKARDALAGIEMAAATLNTARAAMDAFERQHNEIAALVEQAREFAGHPNIQGTASTWRQEQDTVKRHSDAKNWTKAAAALAGLKSASEDLSEKGQSMKDQGAAENAALQATSFIAVKALTVAVHGHEPDDLTRFNTESAAYVATFNTGRYVEAKSHVLAADQAAKRLLAAMAAHDLYKLVATVAATHTTEEALAAYEASKGSALTQDRFRATRSPWVAAFNAKNWPEATKTFRDLLAASKLLLDDALYQSAYDKETKDAITAAERDSTYPPLAGTPAATKFAVFGQAREKLNAALQALDFQTAKKCLPTLKSAADGLLLALAASEPSDAQAFDKGWKLTEPRVNLARDVKVKAGASIPALEMAWRAVLAAQTAMDKAKDAEQWIQARAALAALDQAALRFDAKHKEGVDFEKAYTPVRKKAVADALSVATEALPHLAADSKAYTDLHRSTMSWIGAGNYVEAGKQLVELERLAKVLIAKNATLGTKDSPNGQQIRQLLAQAQALKDRVTEPARDLGTSAIESVTTGANACIEHLATAQPDAALAAKELAQAQAQFAKAEKQRGEVWTAYFKTASAELKAAEQSGAALDKGLKALRDKAVVAGTAAIEKAAERGHFGSATAKTRQLIEETKTWLQAKEAFDALSPDAKFVPQVAQLKKLVERTGGGKVLDAIIEARTQGAGISSELVNVALEARFGFKAQRFEQRNTTGGAADEEGNATKKEAAFTDKSIVQTYKVLAKVPQQHWTAKVNDMIVYDKNDDEKSVGGHFSRAGDKRKIYLYCGRPEGPDKQKFGKGQKVLPEGEQVEDNCQPMDEKEAPLFDFTLLHEAAHAEDDARGYMGQNGGKPDHGGWEVHKGPESFAALVAKHFGYDEAYILATLQSPGSSPPRLAANLPQGRDPTQWERAREDAVTWCRSVRESAQPWEDPALARAVAIQGRVYQESSAGKWVSYDLAARARGISSYQFRAPAEWFAELYAAYFSKKLKPNHPSAKWLKTFKSATARG